LIQLLCCFQPFSTTHGRVVEFFIAMPVPLLASKLQEWHQVLVRLVLSRITVRVGDERIAE
jgi:hypothetical protein